MLVKTTAFLLFLSTVQAFLAWSQEAGPRGALPMLEFDEVPLRIGSDFDYLMLTRIYPTAVCRADDDSGELSSA
ncbi:hypothetical protein OESDEN_21713 [Oesophagostomum dentatum]|uniref:Uncharacterized protein n=1 Tax=Oesophagostomum dentatum TaxID=61180 RepID=A0A0B1S176_OESDE|nr:hypothetical protein OESDEN_21713 [Oesophagostomum dentatum]